MKQLLPRVKTATTVAALGDTNFPPTSCFDQADATGSHVVKAYAHQRCDAFVLSTSTCGGDVSAEEGVWLDAMPRVTRSAYLELFHR